MTAVLMVASAVLIVIGCFFYLAGTVGLLRFPDTHTRLHALTKADGLGLGFVVVGLVLVAPSPAVAAKLVLIWLLVLAASSSVCYLIGGHIRRSGEDSAEQRT